MLHNLIALIERYGLPGMFLLVMTENMGVPLPTEPAYVVGQALITRGSYPYWLVLLVLTAGHLVGSTFSYFAGRRIALGLRTSKDLTEMQHKVAGWYQKYGTVTVFVTRFVGHVRPWSSYVAGIAEVPVWPFLILTAIGSLLFNWLSLAIADRIIYFWQQFALVRILISISFSAGFILLFVQAVKKKQSGKK